MKNWIAVLLGIATISLTACKSDDDYNLVTTMEIRKFDSSKVVDGDLGGATGELADTFEEQEELVFYLELKNEGLGTAEVSWSDCHFVNVEIYNSNNEMVFETDKRPVGCAAVVKRFVLYAGEYQSSYLNWNQELNIDGTGDPSGEFLAPGSYTAVPVISYSIGARGAEKSVSYSMEGQTFEVIAAQAE